MSFLTDTDLDLLLKSSSDERKLVLSPFEKECLTPVGYDLRVGETYITSDMGDVRKDLHEGEAITLRPGTTALITTLEDVRMPKDRSITGLIESKVSQVSKGLSHVSTTVDPDWQGNLLIAIHNHAVEEIKLTYGDAFCTIVFLKNMTAATRQCDKESGRLGIFINEFQARSTKAQRKKRRFDFVPPVILTAISFVGYKLFGDSPSFVGVVTFAVAISSFVERRYLR